MAIALLVTSMLGASFAFAQGQRGALRERLRARIYERKEQRARSNAKPAAGMDTDQSGIEYCNLAGLNVAVWKPAAAGVKSPLVVFSHGYHGANTQSRFLMEALAGAGYLVVAPNHKDAVGSGGVKQSPDSLIGRPVQWTESSYKSRADDLVRLLDALHRNSQWNSLIDWKNVVLTGHSLGGYTVLGLAGGWPGWKIHGLKAILALSPYSHALVSHGNITGVDVPVMYQTGTRDVAILPNLKKPQGAFDQTSSPAFLIEFDKASHFAWTDLNKDPQLRKLICDYSIAFLDKSVKGRNSPTLTTKRPGVVSLNSK